MDDERPDERPDARGDEPGVEPAVELGPVTGPGAEGGAAAAPDPEPDPEPSVDSGDVGRGAQGDALVDAPVEDLLDATPRPLDPSYIDCERFGWRVLWLVVVVLAAVFVGLWVRPGWWGLAALVLAPWPTIEMLSRLGMLYTHRAYGRIHWLLNEDELEIQRGVWWRKLITVPRSRVQHTDVTQGPVQRKYGLATLVVHTAGTHYATVSLEGLRKEHAERVRTHLLTGHDGDAV